MKTILEVNEDVEVLATGADGKRPVSFIKGMSRMCSLWIFRMEKMDGLKHPEYFVQASKANILLLTTFSDDEYIVKALRLGARDIF